MNARTTFGPFVLDRARQTLTRGGQPVPVGHRGYLLLETLLDAGGEPVGQGRAYRTRLAGDRRRGRQPHGPDFGAPPATGSRRRRDDRDRPARRLPARGATPTGRGRRAGPPLIAVLPFANHGGIADDGYFVDGVVDDIITALSRFKTFAVVSRGSSFALRDKGADARTAASEFGVRYALEGSIRRMGDRLRVTAQLLDARAAHNSGPSVTTARRGHLLVPGPHHRKRRRAWSSRSP